MKHLELTENVLVPALILAAGVVVVQAHAIPYWQAAMGAAVGLVASLGAELVGLYLVYQPGRGVAGKTARGAGLLLVGVMVLVPAWVILQPEYAAWRTAAAEAQAAPARHAAAQAVARAQLPDLEADILKNETSLRATEEKSATRAGWLGVIEQQQATLADLRARRDALKATIAAPAPVPAGFDWWGALPRVIPVLALLVAFQLVNAYAVLKIAGWRWGVSAASPQDEAPPEAPEADVGVLQRLLQNPAVPSEAPEAPVAPGDAQAPHSGTAPEAARPAEAKHPAEASASDEAPEAPTVDETPCFTEAPASDETPEARAAPEAPGMAEAPEAPVMDGAPEAMGANDLMVKRLQRAVARKQEELGSGRAVCRAYGINSRDYTWLSKHFARKRDGLPTVSEEKLAALAAKFLSQAEGAQS